MLSSSLIKSNTSKAMRDVGINMMTDNVCRQIGAGFHLEVEKKESVVSVGYT